MNDYKTLRQKIAIKAMAALLSNPHFSKHHLRALHHQKVLNKNDDYFRLIAAYSCQAADSLIARLRKK